MAKSKNPLFSEEAYGDLDGLQYRRGTFGPIVGRRSLTPHLMTPAQTAQRGLLKRAHTAFDALTNSQRAAWDAYAPYPETGRNAYVRAYTVLKKASLTPDNDPRSTPQGGALRLLHADWISVPLRQTIVTWDPINDVNVLVFIYSYSTWSNRTYPKPAKLTYRGAIHANLGALAVTLPFVAPNNWIRAELHHSGTAELIGELIYNLRKP